MTPEIEMASAADIEQCVVVARPVRLRVAPARPAAPIKKVVADKFTRHRRNDRACLCQSCESDRKWQQTWDAKGIEDPEYYGLHCKISSPLQSI